MLYAHVWRTRGGGHFEGRQYHANLAFFAPAVGSSQFDEAGPRMVGRKTGLAKARQAVGSSPLHNLITLISSTVHLDQAVLVTCRVVCLLVVIRSTLLHTCCTHAYTTTSRLCHG